LLTTASEASISAVSMSKARPPSLIGPAVAKIPKPPNSVIAGGIAEGELQAMIKIDIFKENHRFSN